MFKNYVKNISTCFLAIVVVEVLESLLVKNDKNLDLLNNMTE